jgi:hypothetical protein
MTGKPDAMREAVEEFWRSFRDPVLFPDILNQIQLMTVESTLNAALCRMGFASDEMCAHGFRTMASTCLNEQGWHPDLIELQLAHAERDESRGAYNRA